MLVYNVYLHSEFEVSQGVKIPIKAHLGTFASLTEAQSVINSYKGVGYCNIETKDFTVVVTD